VFDGDHPTRVIRVTNIGVPGTLLDVTRISFNPGYTVTSGLPIVGLASGQSVDIVIAVDSPTNMARSLFVVQTNEPGSPTYAYLLLGAYGTPTLSEWMLLLLAAWVGLAGMRRMRAAAQDFPAR
jgi:hypothetical protein